MMQCIKNDVFALRKRINGHFKKIILLLVFVFVMFCMQFICIDFSYKPCILLLKNTVKTTSKMHGLQLKMYDCQ